MPPAQPPADLLPHEIAGPVDYSWLPLPYQIAAGTVLVLLLAGAVWAFVAWHRRKRPPLTPLEKALAALAHARTVALQSPPYEFGIEVCDILRNFLSAEYRLPATTQTSYEFLQTARGSTLFEGDRLARLARFLDKVDAIKFARAEATGEDNVELAGLAEDLVKGGVPDVVAA